MSSFDEFEVPTKPKKASVQDIREQFPVAVEELKALEGVFGEFQVLKLVEGGAEMNTKLNRKIEGMVEINSEQYLAMGELSRWNEQCVNRSKRK